MSTTRYWLKQGSDTHVLIIDEDGTRVVRDFWYVLKEWLENCERVDFEDQFSFIAPVDNRIKEITIRLSSTEEIIVNLDVLVEWYLEHRVKVGLRRLIIEDLKEATDEA